MKITLNNVLVYFIINKYFRKFILEKNISYKEYYNFIKINKIEYILYNKNFLCLEYKIKNQDPYLSCQQIRKYKLLKLKTIKNN